MSREKLSLPDRALQSGKEAALGCLRNLLILGVPAGILIAGIAYFDDGRPNDLMGVSRGMKTPPPGKYNPDIIPMQPTRRPPTQAVKNEAANRYVDSFFGKSFRKEQSAQGVQ